MALQRDLGDSVPVTLCAVGEEYLVDCEDGHEPYRMRFWGVVGGSRRFVDATGARCDLGEGDSVWRVAVPPLVPETSPPSEAAADSVVPPRGGCGAKGVVETRPPSPPWTPPERESNGAAGSALLTGAEVDVLAAVFRDRALAIPRAALSAGTLALLRRLRLVD